MKININAVTNANEIVNDYMLPLLAGSGIKAEPKEVKIMVLNKEGNWVEFPGEKIQFSYTK